MRKLIPLLLCLSVVACKNDKEEASQRIMQIDKKKLDILELKKLHLKNYQTTHEPGDTVELYRWRDSVNLVIDNLDRERDSLNKVYSNP